MIRNRESNQGLAASSFIFDLTVGRGQRGRSNASRIANYLKQEEYLWKNLLLFY